MCGLAAIFAYRSVGEAVECNELFRIREAMAPRGPDGAGTWISDDGRVGLAHRRLSIIDLSANGAQPMADSLGNSVVFNGEIYNYRELREELEHAGWRFHSQSDTEVILAVYSAYGNDGFARLRGMFALTLWDARRRCLVVVRDPYGIKPLYWHDDGTTVRIASQVKALVAGGRVGTETDAVAEASFYLWGFIPEPRTVLRGVTAVPPGTVTEVDASGVGPSRSFASIVDTFAAAAAGSIDAAGGAAEAMLHDALSESVARHMIADVPVGVFLSAGIDSTVVLALATRAAQQPLHAVTIGFREYIGRPDDEVPLARVAAAAYGAHHQVVIVEQSEFEQDFAAIIAAMDQPTIDGVNSYFVAKVARQAGLKTCLSGLGGDELFGGYPTARDLPRWRRLLPLARVPGLAATAALGMDALCSLPGVCNRLHRKFINAPRFMADDDSLYFLKRGYYFPADLASIMDADRLNDAMPAADPVATVKATVPPIANDYARICAQESAIYMRSQLLRDIDWAGGAQGLEVRVPLADYTLLRAAAPHLARRVRMDKSWMISAVDDLPAAIRNKPKTGFHMPIDRWVSELELTRSLRARHGGLKDWAQVVWRGWVDSLR